MTTPVTDRFLRLDDVVAKIGFAETAFYEMVGNNCFPRPATIGARDGGVSGK